MVGSQIHFGKARDIHGNFFICNCNCQSGGDSSSKTPRCYENELRWWRRKMETGSDRYVECLDDLFKMENRKR